MLQFNPVKGKVLIRKDKMEDTTASGILIGKSSTGRCVTAEVVSGERAGERIVFTPGISNAFDVGSEQLTVIFEYDIIAYL